MWYPEKVALRAGYAVLTDWDDHNIGHLSVAMGYSPVASGDYSTALGYLTIAAGDYSTALGDTTTASGWYSTALGTGTTASDYASTAMGYGTTASGFTSTAMGWCTTALGDSATALGYFTTASGYVSTALGHTTTASGETSTAFGYTTTARSAFEVAIGSRNTDYKPGSAVDWYETDRLFVIGNGRPLGDPSDALVILKNGNVGIGGSEPAHLLQLGYDSAAKPGTTTWLIASDARLKDISGPYESGLDEIAALQPVRYHYAEGNARGHDPEPEYVGFIAQQAQPVFPEAVSEGADGYLDFNMHAVNVAMVNAIQMLREQNLALESQLQAQQARFQTQTEQLQTLREQNQEQGGQLQALGAQIAALRADKAALAQRLVSLEAENAHHARLQADLAQLQALVQILQG